MGTVIHGQGNSNSYTHEAHHTSNSANMSEELKAELEKQKAITLSMEQQVQDVELANELERQKQQQEVWQVALDKLQQARAEQEQRHREKLATIKVVETVSPGEDNAQLEWIKTKLAELHGKPL